MRELDYGVGVILNKLIQLQIDDNTFVFFSSDNGAATYAKERGESVQKLWLSLSDESVRFTLLPCYF